MTERIEYLKRQMAKETAELAVKISILETLPDSVPEPTISNMKPDATGDQVFAWLSFHAPSYDPGNTWAPIAVLQALEGAGFVQSPASLCKWGNYRRTTWPALVEDVPEQKAGSFGRPDELTDCDPIAPLWIEPQQHGQCEIRLYMRHGQRLYRIRLDGGHIATVGARQIRRMGGWHFEPNTATVRFPEDWHSLPDATIHQATRGYVDTEQGLSGAIYFAPHGQQCDWPLKASDFLGQLAALVK